MEPSDSGSPYNLRSKRRRLNENGDEEATRSHFVPRDPWRRKNPIMHMPLEVLQNVFRFISYRELSDKVRRINRKFKLATEDLLNKTFKGHTRRLRDLTEMTFTAIETTGDDMEMKCLCRLLNMLEIVRFQQSVIMATIWRYVYNHFYRTNTTCMYGGLLLDFFDTFLHKFLTCPYQIYGPAVVKDYATSHDVEMIVQLTKTFCIHFDKIVEEADSHSISFHGCKIVDLLDCATFCRRTVVFEKINGNSFSAKYCYYFQNSWFVAFGISPEKEMCDKQKQRMMHMRIRRIILAHTEMFMQQHHHERELVTRLNPSIRKPGIMVYTGYGDVHDTFFCYGAMNDAAYFQKFHQDDPLDTDEDEGLFDANNFPIDNNAGNVYIDLNNNVNNNNNNNNNNNDGSGSDSDFLFVPYLGLDVDVRIDCPLSYAPLQYIRANEHLFRKTSGGHHQTEVVENCSKGLFDININFNCQGAYYPRLPQEFNYHKRISTRLY